MSAMKALPRCEARAGGSTGASWSEDGRGWAESQNPPRLRRRERAVKLDEANLSPLPATIFPTMGKRSLAVMERLNYAPARRPCLFGWRVVAGATAWGCGLFRFAPRWMASVAVAGAGAGALGCGLLNLVVPGGVSQNTRIRRQRALVIVLPPASLKHGQCADRS